MGRTERRGRPSIVWFTDDLRLADNAALSAAVEAGDRVLPVYVFDEASPGVRPLGGASRWMLHGALDSLARDLAAAGASLTILRGPAAHVLADLAASIGAETVHAMRQRDPARAAVASELGAALEAVGARLVSHDGFLLHDPDHLRTRAGGPHRVFSHFWRAFRREVVVPDPQAAPVQVPGAEAPTGESLDSLGLLPTRPDWAGGLRERWPVGEAAAMEVAEAFMAGRLEGYAVGRDRPALRQLSGLSPYLRFGMISPAQVWHLAEAADVPDEDREKFLQEVVWRDFCWHLLHHFPHISDETYDARFERIGWQWDSPHLRDWTRGRTGVPFVDAGMRQLWVSGTMHNRLRMVTASFLVKNLNLHWKVGEAWFWDTLVDADLAVNAVNWQWVAGCGPDAAPYFRVFNPVTQGERYDSDGAFVRDWVRELDALPDSCIHAPWTCRPAARTEGLQERYPTMPVVALAEARERAIAAFRRARSGD